MWGLGWIKGMLIIPSTLMFGENLENLFSVKNPVKKFFPMKESRIFHYLLPSPRSSDFSRGHTGRTLRSESPARGLYEALERANLLEKSLIQIGSVCGFWGQWHPFLPFLTQGPHPLKNQLPSQSLLALCVFASYQSSYLGAHMIMSKIIWPIGVSPWSFLKSGVIYSV